MKSFKFVMVLMVALMFSSMAMADWELPGSHFGLVKGASLKSLGIVPVAASGETDLILLPTAGIGFSVSNGATASYGFDLAYDLMLTHLTPGDGTTINATSYFGVGLSAFLDAGPSLSSNFSNSPIVRLGVNIIGPEISGVVPAVLETFDLNTGEKKTLVMMKAPFIFADGTGIVKVAKVGN